jgi:hypothetical protein
MLYFIISIKVETDIARMEVCGLAIYHVQSNKVVYDVHSEPCSIQTELQDAQQHAYLHWARLVHSCFMPTGKD